MKYSFQVAKNFVKLILQREETWDLVRCSSNRSKELSFTRKSVNIAKASGENSGSSPTVFTIFRFVRTAKSDSVVQRTRFGFIIFGLRCRNIAQQTSCLFLRFHAPWQKIVFCSFAMEIQEAQSGDLTVWKFCIFVSSAIAGLRGVDRHVIKRR